MPPMLNRDLADDVVSVTMRRVRPRSALRTPFACCCLVGRLTALTPPPPQPRAVEASVEEAIVRLRKTLTRASALKWLMISSTSRRPRAVSSPRTLSWDSQRLLLDGLRR
jgi:hypothetical protein